MDPFYKILILCLAVLAGVLTSFALGAWRRNRLAKKSAEWQKAEQDRRADFQTSINELGGRDG